MAKNLESFSKNQLLKEIEFLQDKVDKCSHDDKESRVLHDLEVYQFELEVQNRELREAHIQIEEARDNYADLYDFSPVNYFTFDRKGIIKNINLTGASMLCKVRGHVIGLPFSIWLDKNSKNTFRKHISRAFETDGKIFDEIQIINDADVRIDARIESIRTKYRSIDEFECRSVILDVTESNKIKNELFLQARQLETITNSLPVLIAYININEHHLFANKIYASTFGLSTESIIGKSIEEILGGDIYKKISKYISHSLLGEQVKFDMEIPTSGEGRRYFHATLIPDTDISSKIYGVTIFIGDITNRLAIESIYRKRLLEISHISRLNTMGEMTTEIAHELNQPLAAITTYSDACRRLLLSDQDHKEQIIQTLIAISAQAERAGQVIRRIREFTTKKDLKIDLYNINDIVNEALSLLNIEIKAHNVQLDLILNDELPELYLDKILIEQVIFNIVRNALEAMDEVDKYKRELQIKTSAVNNDQIEISIKDTGPGIDVAATKSIFTAFNTSKADGMGMGLAISQSIVKAHHGRIWSSNNDQGGSTFVFTLPLNATKG